MQTYFAVLSLAAMAIASPVGQPGTGYDGDSPKVGDIQSCGNKQTTVCCDNGDGANAGAGDLLGGLLGGLLAGGCTLPILSQNCGGSPTFCCDANQSGLINVGTPCIPLTL